MYRCFDDLEIDEITQYDVGNFFTKTQFVSYNRNLSEMIPSLLIKLSTNYTDMQKTPDDGGFAAM